MYGYYVDNIKKRLDTFDNGDIFIANDFLDIADYETVRKALNRLAADGSIQKIMRGVYYRPRYSELIGEYEAPSPHNMAQAIARKFNWNIAPSGSAALNMLGLSTQVPAKWSYISDGPYNQYELGKSILEFKHRNNREIAGMSPKTALIIQCIKAIGKGNIDSAAIEKIRASLTGEERKMLLNEASSSVMWVYQVIKQICAEG